jgi:two-component system response regulator YesN
MKKIIIVDDEPIVIEALKKLINWNENGYEIIGSASNGKHAIELINNGLIPDIVITDISMPVMDGLELINYLKAHFPYIVVLVLSVYSEYDKVREAFSCGASDYILKTNLATEEIFKVLSRVQKKKEGEIQSQWLRIDRCFQQIIRSKNLSSEDILKILQDNGINWHSAKLGISVMEYDKFDANNKDDRISPIFMQAYEYINIKQCKNEEIKALCFSIGLNKFAFVMCCPNLYSIKKINETMYEFSNTYIHWSRNIEKAICTSGFSGCFEDWGNFNLYFDKALQLLEQKFFLGEGKVITEKISIKNSQVKQFSLKSELDRLFNSLMSNSEETLLYRFKRLLDNVIDISFGNVHTARMLFNYIRSEICHYSINVLGIKLHNENGIFYKNLLFSNYSTAMQFKSVLENQFIQMLKFVYKEQQPSEKKIVDKACCHIKENLSKNLSLQDVAEYVGISPGYLSKIFKKVTGKTYCQFMTQKRIEKAMFLLKNYNYKVYAVSSHVGYANVEHFSRTFKKITGVSPQDYRGGKRVC